MDTWDTGGQDAFKSVRPLCYNGADCFAVCFDLMNEQSLENACTKWTKELTDHGPDKVPRILVGTKTDLRNAITKEGNTCFITKE